MKIHIIFFIVLSSAVGVLGLWGADITGVVLGILMLYMAWDAWRAK